MRTLWPRASKFGSFLDPDRGLVNNCSAAAGGHRIGASSRNDYRTKCLKPGSCFRRWFAEDQHHQHPFGAILAVSKACVSKTQQPSVGCQEFALAGIAGSVRLFSACWNAPFRRNSARFGARFSAFFGVFWRFSVHARGEIDRAFFVCPRRVFQRVAGGGHHHR